MNYKLVSRLIGIIFYTLSLAFAISWLVGIGVSSESESVEHGRWAICLAIALVSATLLWLFGKGAGSKLFRREAMATIGIGWILASMLGAVPYLVIMPGTGMANAYFESVSGLTTTGATIFSDLEQIPPALMVWRCMSQWIGGLGVVVLFVAILSFLGAGGKILYSNESTATSAELDSSRVQSGVAQIFILYVSLSFLCASAYYAAGLTLEDAVLHTFSTISTGGFSPHTSSIAHFENSLLEWICIGFMALGGTSFLVMIRILQRRPGIRRQLAEVYLYYALLIGGTAFVFILNLQGELLTWENIHQNLRSAAFQVVSLMTSTGYTSTDYGQWLPGSQFILLGLMLIGGCSGSTAGGTKVIRTLLVWKLSIRQIERSMRSRLVRMIRINGRTIDEDDLEQNVVYLLLFASLFMLSIPIMSMFQSEMSMMGMIGSIIACLNNIGPGFAETGPTNAYGFLSAPTKLYLSFLMLLGRIEFYAVLVLFTPMMWKRSY